VGSPAPPEEAWTDRGGDGPPLVLTHANGFPPETYRTEKPQITQMDADSIATFHRSFTAKAAKNAKAIAWLSHRTIAMQD